MKMLHEIKGDFMRQYLPYCQENYMEGFMGKIGVFENVSVDGYLQGQTVR